MNEFFSKFGLVQVEVYGDTGGIDRYDIDEDTVEIFKKAFDMTLIDLPVTPDRDRC